MRLQDRTVSQSTISTPLAVMRYAVATYAGVGGNDGMQNTLILELELMRIQLQKGSVSQTTIKDNRILFKFCVLSSINYCQHLRIDDVAFREDTYL